MRKKEVFYLTTLSIDKTVTDELFNVEPWRNDTDSVREKH